MKTDGWITILIFILMLESCCNCNHVFDHDSNNALLDVIPNGLLFSFLDVISIRKLNTMALQKLFKSLDFSNQGLHSGFVFQLLKHKVVFMCFNKRDFKNLRYLLEAIFRIKLLV